MSYKKYIIVGLLLLGVALALAACGSTATQEPCPTSAPCPTAAPPPACPTSAPCPDCPTCPEPVVKDVPYQELWVNSGHADAAAEAFRHWDSSDPQVVPTSCAQCHTPTGFMDFIGADGSAAGVVDAAQPVSNGLTCIACHNDAAAALSSVTFPSGAVITGLGPEARCMTCHQGRASKVQVDDALAKFNVTENLDVVPEPITSGDTTSSLGFINMHYFAAAATLYGNQAHGGYEYDGKLYDSKNDHVEGLDTCIGCHDQHSLEVKVEKCAECHEGVTTAEDLKNVRMPASSMDYDGDGNVTEGIYGEITGLQDSLYAAIQAYAEQVAGTPIVYDAATYPYFFADTDKDGQPDQGDNGNVAFTAWTGRLVRTTYNYQMSIKDAGAFAHGSKYIIQLLYDSIQDLNSKLSTPIDMSAMHRDDAAHFAGNTMPFRDWDSTGEVPFACVKCHTATGLPEFIHNGGTMIVDSRGNTTITGVSAMSPSNGFACSTCHDTSAFPNRIAVTTVPFPSGASLTFSVADADGNLQPADSNLCIECHQGRESTTSVNAALKGKDPDTVDPKIRFKNVHYLSSGATLFGSDAMGMYQYADQEYAGKSQHPVTDCVACHDAHALTIKEEICQACHGEVTDVTAIRMGDIDYDGDGDTTEGVAGEIATLRDALYTAIQAYAETTAGTAILYDPNTYPYFYADADKDGNPDKNDSGATVSYSTWTPRLMEAAYNLHYAFKEPGAFVHNPTYVMQVLYDSIKDVGGDVTGMTRP
jgi:hypothetical protein